MKFKQSFSSVLLIASASFLLSACTLFPTTSSNPSPNVDLTSTPLSPTATVNLTTPSPTTNTQTVNAEPIIGLDTKYGQIVIKLNKKDAPNSVANFIKKVETGFYNSLTFHRVEPGFVVQGGDPLGNGTGGGSQKSELNPVPFVKGSVGLARGPDRNITNDSQFFICLSTENCSSLTGDYVNIGQVVSGMDVVSQIKVGDKILQFTDKSK